MALQHFYHKAGFWMSPTDLFPLPNNLATKTTVISRAPVFLFKRPGRTFFTAAIIFLLALVCFFGGLQSLPPLYERYHKYESQLPQHSLHGGRPKYIWMNNHVRNGGWGNYMQELVMNAQLAYVSNRAFVFDNFTWDREGIVSWTLNNKIIPSRIPLSAMISGPITGGPFPPKDTKPRAVSKDFFNHVCPHPTIINSQEINEHLRFDENVSAGFILDKWVEKLNSIDDPCVEIPQKSDPIFEIWQFGNKRILDVWPSLSKSPIITQFDWAPLIKSAVQANALLLRPAVRMSAPAPAPAPENSVEFFPDLLTIHVRRGDYKQHCRRLAKWSARYNGFNDFDSFRDEERFSPPLGGGRGKSTPENMGVYLGHCYPTMDRIVEKVMAVRSKTEGLKNVYVMTNAPIWWLDDLKTALRRAHNWDRITTSRDMPLSWEQKYVGHAVDMMIAERSKAFIGNGFSSMTSNTVMLRMAKGLHPHTNHFW